MGSQPRSALPQAPVPESDPARTEKKSGSKKAAQARRRKRILTPPEPHVRPAFLMDQAAGDEEDGSSAPKCAFERAPETEADKAASERKDEATTAEENTETNKKNAPLKLRSIYTEESETEAGEQADGSDEAEKSELDTAIPDDEAEQSELDTAIPDAAATDDDQGDGEVNDPDLIALLEQLSETIDTANQVLAEAPPPADTAAMNEYAAAAGYPPVSEQPAPPLVKDALQRRSVTGLTTMTVAGLAVLLTVGGGFLWFNNDPSLMEGVPTRDMAATVSRDGEQILVRSSGSADLNTPIPAVAVPLPPRKPQPDEAVAGAAPFSPQEAIPTLPAAPETTKAPAAVQTAAAPEQAAVPATAVAGPAGRPIALELKVPGQGGGQVSIMIRGVPNDAKLSAGSKVGGGTWVLEEKDLSELALVTPAAYPPGDVKLDVVMVRSDGRIPQSHSVKVQVQPGIAPATIKASTSSAVRTPVATAPAAPKPSAPKAPAVAATPKPSAPKAPAVAATPKPAAAPESSTAKAPTAVTTLAPEAAAPAKNAKPADNVQGVQKTPVPIQQLTAEEEARYLKRGDELLKLGDVASARLILEHAARRESTRAMTALAKTYDPDYLAKLGVRGVKPDIDQAIVWYERASRKADR